ncbi:tRNA (adenine-N1)-methyltransferase [Actinomadura madurae]|uniref:tRNA (adenine-N1)-methyltransferase n=1 Tax=Actinomadura madurae TaxID=1993 RepID=UPI0020269FA8|nr:tRNA (adenine-N1)-methyltransferase [Actinomadura madurae]MCP9947830.1 tRNA (adenine-N1)-methyltransferase [Actinomadura madurae]MCP9964597.1 tRNA (adenine-N1)-methyltransferase [Actinomadura madurae]MCP9977073.1 tRNA (adenine-N1)-methyltransferase [Actinomadura madurae]URN04216.1 tRNA (adenine-N1)-methyltransferase [Actinomadura madurae]
MSEPTPHRTTPTPGRASTGPFRPGDQVQLTDPKGRINTITLQPGKHYHSHKGSVPHDDIIGSPEGTVYRSTGGTEYLAFRPLLTDFTLRMPRGAAVVYPKDAAQIIAMADIFPGARVIEAGAGSGALTCFLLRAVGEHGHVHSYERRPDFADIARANVEKFFGAPHPSWTLTVGSLEDALTDTGADRVVLDMLAPWETLDPVAKALNPGGIICAYIATTTQMSRIVEDLRAHGAFAEPHAFETLLRTWHVDGLAVRPDHRMIGHTGFLVTARRLADGVTPPARRRRPAKGAHPAANGHATPGPTAES